MDPSCHAARSDILASFRRGCETGSGWGGRAEGENVCEAASLFSRKRQKLKNKAPTPTPMPPPTPLEGGKKRKKEEETCECWLCWNGRVRREGRERESCCVYICKAAGRQQCVRLRLWPNLSSSLLPQTHQSSKTGPSRPRRTLGGPRTGMHGRARGLCTAEQNTDMEAHTNIAATREVFACF